MIPRAHIWGVSPAQDRVWAQVCGLGPTAAKARLFMVFQAYIDESYDSGTFVLGGCIASAESWAEFSRKWEALLPTHGICNKEGRYYFKMKEMRSPERIRRVPEFFRLIEEHVPVIVSAELHIPDIRRAQSRLFVPNRHLDWSRFSHPYMVTFRGLLDALHDNRQMIAKYIPVENKIDFYFDNHTKKKLILPGWDDYIRNSPDERKRQFGATPRFEDDLDFLPLQAADFVAWWSRKWHNDGIQLSEELDFGTFKRMTKKEMFRIVISADEDRLASIFKNMMRSANIRDPIYDVKLSVGLSS